MDKYKAESPFFKKVWDSMKEFADSAVPFWAQAQRTNANLAESTSSRRRSRTRHSECRRSEERAQARSFSELLSAVDLGRERDRSTRTR